MHFRGLGFVHSPSFLALMRCSIFLVLVAATRMAVAQLNTAPPAEGCGEVVTIATHAGTSTRYAFLPAASTAVHGSQFALVMLVGGGGYLNLDDKGCPQLLHLNSLVRMRPLLHDAGIATALVDAPSDLRSDEGLGAFRVASKHADDLGNVIADVRERTQGAVWIIGHSRGTISAVNAAARLAGPPAPDGVMLLSAMLAGDIKASKFWAAHTVFSIDLEAIKVPVLVIGHAADNCVRSPAGLMDRITAKTRGTRQQVVTVTGGPFTPGRFPDVAACQIHQPHDFVDQESEVAAGIVRFIRGGSY